MRYGSVCSGIEAATVAWHPLGWRPVFFAEIDRFPSAVLAYHYPGTPNFGDLKKIGDRHGSIDVLVGGTPCQSFSIAGLRGGLADDRGNLALEFLRLAQRARARWLVWENVPGVLSSNGGRDFGAILGGMVELGYGVAYRVLDAQFVRVDCFGRALPQRRRRVFVVGHLGSWQRAAAVLFERASLLGNPAPRREAWEDVAGPLGGSAQSGGFRTTDLDNQGAFIAEHADPIEGARYLGNAEGGAEELPFLTLSNLGKTVNNQTPLVGGLVAFSAKDYGNGAAVDIAPTLRGMNEIDGNANAGGQLAVAFKAAHYTRGKDGAPADIFPPLGAEPDKGDQDAVVCVQEPVAFESRLARNGRGAPEPICPPLKAQSGESGKGDSAPLVAFRWTVRRLTPRECERLQGFPDDYTLVPYRGGIAADGPRYKALGNSMAVNCMRWIGRRIEMVDALPAAMVEAAE